MSVPSTGFRDVNGSPHSHVGSYNERVATLGALAFDLLISALVCVGFGEDNAEPLSMDSEFINQTIFCNEWEDSSEWKAIDTELSSSSNMAAAPQVWMNAYVLAVSSFAVSLAAFLILCNAVCCPLNGRYRAQSAAGFFYLAITGMGVATIVLISSSDVIDVGVWDQLGAALNEASMECQEESRLVLQPGIVTFGVALLLALLSIFTSFKVCCCGCCTVTVYEG